MNVCMVLHDKDAVDDGRVLSEAQRLVEDGHRVLVVCDHRPGAPSHEVYAGAEVARLDRASRLWHPLNRAIELLLLVNVRWLGTLLKLHRELGLDAIHVHDLPMARTGQWAGRWVKRPVVLDLHENWPVLMQDFWPRQMRFTTRWKKRLFYGLPRWQRYERRSVRQAARVIVVVDEAKKRIMGLGVPAERVTVVSNTLRDYFVDFPERDPQLEAAYAGRFVISYIGSLAGYVRLDTVVRAMPLILEHVPNAHLLVVGKIDAKPEYRELAERLGVSQHVTFERWQPQALVPAYMGISDVGLLPFTPDEYWHTTMPNKLFQYMYMRCPVLASESRAVGPILSAEGCGRTVPGMAGDPAILAAAIIELAQDPAERAAMGKRGREAVLSRYRWRTEGNRLSRLYASLRGFAGGAADSDQAATKPTPV
jgi:glycosyltransferase involved in cell wall biosynthesis